MVWTYPVSCDACGAEGEVQSGLIYYRLEGGVEFAGLACSLWCFTCDNLSTRETLPGETALNEKLDELREHGICVEELRDRCRFLRTPFEPEAELNRQLDAVTTQLDWLRNRMWPPRCLSCGSVEYQDHEMHSVNDSLIHPSCGGSFRIRSELVSHGIQGRFTTLDAEGHRLQKATGDESS